MAEYFDIQDNILLSYHCDYPFQKSVIIPDGVTTIAENAFSDWTTIPETLVIPESVTKVENNDFRYPLLWIIYAGNKYTLYYLISNRSEAVRMIVEKKLNANLPREGKFIILMQMLVFYPENKKMIDYLRRKSFTAKETFQYLIEENQPKLAKILLDKNIFRMKRQIDALIQYANQKKAYEIQLLLTDYKFRHIDFKPPEDKLKL